MTVVPFDTFEVLFSSPVVRVGLNFELLRDAGAVVTLQAVTDSDVLSGWSLPWYHRPDGTPCRFDVVGARPCTVREAADRAVTLNSYIDAAVDMYADTLRYAASFMVVTYSWGADSRVVLDGCHRAVATVRHRLPVRVAQFDVSDPCLPDVAADMTWWSQQL